MSHCTSRWGFVVIEVHKRKIQYFFSQLLNNYNNQQSFFPSPFSHHSPRFLKIVVSWCAPLHTEFLLNANFLVIKRNSILEKILVMYHPPSNWSLMCLARISETSLVLHTGKSAEDDHLLLLKASQIPSMNEVQSKFRALIPFLTKLPY